MSLRPYKSLHLAETGGGINFVRAVEFVRPMRGSNRPALVRCDDGRYFIVKLLQECRHPRALANELLAAKLAGIVGLPVLDVALVGVPEGMLACWGQGYVEKAGIDHRTSASVHFGVCYPYHGGRALVTDFLPALLLRSVKNLSIALVGGFIFDRWTCNVRPRKVVFTKVPDRGQFEYTAWLIGHDACFNDGDWSAPLVPDQRTRISPSAIENVDVPRALSQLLPLFERLDASEIRSAAKNIPPAWCGAEPAQVFTVAGNLSDALRSLRGRTSGGGRP